MSHSATPWTIYSSWNSPGQHTGVGSLSLLQGIFPTQGSNPRLPHCRQFFTSWATELLQNRDSALGSDEDRKSPEPVSSCFSLPHTTATQSFRVPCGSPDSQQTWANRSPSTVSFASSWHFALLLGNFHLKIHSKPWVVRAMTWLEMFLLLQPISSANKPCSGDTDRKRHLPSSITWRTLNLTIFLIL